MTYDPFLSHSLSSIDPDQLDAIASYVLNNHSGLMDEDAVDLTNFDRSLELLDEPTDLQWLLKYMEHHYNQFGSHFEWQPARFTGA